MQLDLPPLVPSDWHGLDNNNRLTDIEILRGSAFSDVLIGNADDNIFIGGRGRIILTAGPGLTPSYSCRADGLNPLVFDCGLFLSTDRRDRGLCQSVYGRSEQF